MAALAVFALATLTSWSPSSFAATPATYYAPNRVENPDVAAGPQWGERLARASDINGDGVNEIFVGVPAQERVYLLSGRTRSVIYRIESPESQPASFGFFISVLGDVSGDGKDDIAVGASAFDVYTGAGPPCGAPEPNGCNEDQGRAWVFSGASGAVLYQLDNPKPQPNQTGGTAHFGSRIGRAGDLNGDGRSEVLVGAPRNDVPAGCANADPVPAGCREDEGEVFIFDGSAAGPPVRSTALRTLGMPDPVTTGPGASCSSECGTFGLAVQGPGDVDGDGVTDQLVDASSFKQGQGRMYLFSGNTGALLARIDDPVPHKATTFGFQDAAPLAPGDLNGDGRAELYGHGFNQNGPTGPAEGLAWVFDGRATVARGSGVVLFGLRDPTPELGGQFGWSLDRTDYNKDGTPDLYVGSAPHHVPAGTWHGGTYVFDGRNGSVLKRLELPPGDAQPRDGPAGRQNGPALGWGLAAPGDLNGDGEPDFAAGAPYMDIGSVLNQGRVYVFMSGPTPRRSVPAARPTCQRRRATIVGTKRADRLRGTRRRDVIVAGAGNDRISARGGNDIVCASSGRDRVRGGSGKDRIAGGSGNDRIGGASGNDRLAGNAGRDRLSGGSGNDRLSGNASNDRLLGGSGRDRLFGNGGRDLLFGGTGRDVLFGNSGADRLAGGPGRDRLIGGAGRDRSLR